MYLLYINFNEKSIFVRTNLQDITPNCVSIPLIAQSTIFAMLNLPMDVEN